MNYFQNINSFRFDELDSVRTYLMYMIISLFILQGCCKKGDDEIPSKKDLLTSTWWKLTHVGNMPADIEDYWIFKPNGIYSNSQSGTWSLADDNQTLTLITISTDHDYLITELTETTFKFKYKYVDGGYMSFTALSGAKLTTIGASALTRNSVVLHGVVRTNKTPVESIIFEYGTSTSYGQEVSTATSNIPSLTLMENIDATVSGINLATTYHYRIKAKSGAETFYGQDQTFRTYNTELLNDINGNNYNTVIIGTQEWMVENLRAINYNNGSSIPLVTDNLKWASMTSPSYCWYNNDSLNYKNKYGAIYNWYAVNTGNICPTGWHVPSEQDWLILFQYLDPNPGSKLCEYGTNSTGFSARGAGFRWDDDGTFGPEDGNFFWTSTEENTSNAVRYVIDAGSFTKYSDQKDFGFSVRCVKDN